MSNKKKLIATEAQVRAIGEAADMLSAMIGGGEEFDVEAKKLVKLLDNFLKKNNLKRKYK